MQNWTTRPIKSSMIGAMLAAAAVSAVISVSVTRTAGQAPATRPARTVDDKPNLSGIWQANNEAHWDLEAHAARAGAVMQEGIYPYPYARVPAAPVVALGAVAGVPGSLGVVQGGGEIPYTPEAAAIKQENGDNCIDRDPELKCLPPRDTARDVYALSFGNYTEHQQDSYGVRVCERRAHYSSGRCRPPARLHLHGTLGRSLGR